MKLSILFGLLALVAVGSATNATMLNLSFFWDNTDCSGPPTGGESTLETYCVSFDSCLLGSWDYCPGIFYRPNSTIAPGMGIYEGYTGQNCAAANLVAAAFHKAPTDNCNGANGIYVTNYQCNGNSLTATICSDSHCTQNCVTRSNVNGCVNDASNSYYMTCNSDAATILPSVLAIAAALVAMLSRF